MLLALACGRLPALEFRFAPGDPRDHRIELGRPPRDLGRPLLQLRLAFLELLGPPLGPPVGLHHLVLAPGELDAPRLEAREPPLGLLDEALALGEARLGRDDELKPRIRLRLELRQLTLSRLDAASRSCSRSTRALALLELLLAPAGRLLALGELPPGRRPPPARAGRRRPPAARGPAPLRRAAHAAARGRPAAGARSRRRDGRAPRARPRRPAAPPRSSAPPRPSRPIRREACLS